MALTWDYVIQNNKHPCKTQRGFETHLLYQHRTLGYPPILQFRYLFFYNSSPKQLRDLQKKNRPQETTHPIQHLQTSYSVILTKVASEFSNLEGTSKQTKLNEWLVHILHTMLARVVCNCDNTLPDSTKRALMGKKLQWRCLQKRSPRRLTSLYGQS